MYYTVPPHCLAGTAVKAVWIFCIYYRGFCFQCHLHALGAVEQKLGIPEVTCAHEIGLPMLLQTNVVQERLVVCFNSKRYANFAGPITKITVFSRTLLKDT